MKTLTGLTVFALLAILLVGCGSKTDGPDEITTSAALQAVQQVPPADGVPVDKEPELVKNATPVYPEQAKKNGLEGTVYVKVWVDKEGKVRDAVIQKSDGEIFNQASLDAAKQFLFTPALKDGTPVSVWVTVPFRYKLADKAEKN